MTITNYTLSVDFEVWKAIQNKRPVEGFTENDVLREMLGLPARQDEPVSLSAQSEQPRKRQHIHDLGGIDGALARIKAHLGVSALNNVSPRMRSGYASPDGGTRVLLLFSRPYHSGSNYCWYSIYAYQKAFLATNTCHIALFVKGEKRGVCYSRRKNAEVV